MKKDILREFIEEVVLGEGSKTKTPIGLVSNELRLEYRNFVDSKKDLEAELEFKHKRAMEKVERDLEEEYSHRFEELSNYKKNLWNKIRFELDIEEGSELNIDHKTGLISKWVTKE
jgi:hypothetical protein